MGNNNSYISRRAEFQQMISSGELDFPTPSAPPEQLSQANYDKDATRRLMRALSNGGSVEFIREQFRHADPNRVNQDMTGVFRLLYQLKYYELLIVAVQACCILDQDWLMGLCLSRQLKDRNGKVWNNDIMVELAKFAPPICRDYHQMILDARYNGSQKDMKGNRLREMEAEYATLLGVYKSLYSR